MSSLIIHDLLSFFFWILSTLLLCAHYPQILWQSNHAFLLRLPQSAHSSMTLSTLWFTPPIGPPPWSLALMSNLFLSYGLICVDQTKTYIKFLSYTLLKDFKLMWLLLYLIMDFYTNNLLYVFFELNSLQYFYSPQFLTILHFAYNSPAKHCVGSSLVKRK